MSIKYKKTENKRKGKENTATFDEENSRKIKTINVIKT